MRRTCPHSDSPALNRGAHSGSPPLARILTGWSHPSSGEDDLNQGLIRSITLRVPAHLSFTIASSNPLDTPCALPGLQSGGHSGLTNKSPHVLIDTTMTALAAGNSSHDITAPTNVTLGRVLQNMRLKHGRKHDPRLRKSRRQPQTNASPFLSIQRQTPRTLKPVCKSSQKLTNCAHGSLSPVHSKSCPQCFGHFTVTVALS